MIEDQVKPAQESTQAESLASASASDDTRTPLEQNVKGSMAETPESLDKKTRVRGQTTMSDQEVSREPYIAKLLRESAIVLAAATGLIYLLGHIYVEAYLETLGIGGGFHGVGISNLALIPGFFIAILAICVGFLYFAMALLSRSY